MPTTFTDQFFDIDPFNPPPVGTALNFSSYDLIDQNDDGDVDRFDNDSVNGQDVTSSWPGDVLTVNVPGVGNITYVGTTFYLADGTRVFTPTDGQVLQNGTYVSSTGVTTQGPLDTGTDLGPTCFTAGTLIRTVDGDCAIEDLKVGDQVETVDNGPQEIRWIGRSPTCATGRFAPVVFKPGAIGNEKTLRVSPQHRMLVQGWRAELFFGGSEVLVPAKHLIDGDFVVQEPAKTVMYYHILFDQHEIVTSNGVLSESFFPGDHILLNDVSVRAELLELFPDLANRVQSGLFKTARPTLKKKDASVLVA
ncbi:MAG: Hint domain-containing protein [Paracoccaceae bacterium]